MPPKGVKRKQAGRSDEDDIHSVLPREVIARILGKLPICEAVRSSILSKKWRFYYLYIPQLVFDDQFCNHLSRSRVTRVRLSPEEIITQSLMLHRGTFESFEVCLPGPYPLYVSYVNKWILHLSWRNIKKLTLIYPYVPQLMARPNADHKLPSYFFSLLNLTSLKLQSNVLLPPPDFKGFPNLDELILIGVNFLNNCFGRFVSSCPTLRSLVLHGCSGIHHFNIRGSNLKSLSIKANDFKSISLENAPNLSEVSVFLENNAVTHPFSNLAMFVGSLPQVKILRLNGSFLQLLLVEKPVPAMLSLPPYSLKILELKGVNFMDFNQISAVVCLLRSSSNLQEFYIEASTIKLNQEKVSGYLKRQDNKTFPLTKLHLAKLSKISSSVPELEFIRFLLFSSPSLVTMSILVDPRVRAEEALSIATKVYQFKPQSAASIEFSKDKY